MLSTFHPLAFVRLLQHILGALIVAIGDRVYRSRGKLLGLENECFFDRQYLTEVIIDVLYIGTLRSIINVCVTVVMKKIDLFF
jgi:hypothetical protein